MEVSGKKTPKQKKEIQNERMQFKLKLRKQKMKEAINHNRYNYDNPIAGYNLSAYEKKKMKDKQKCWKCGKSGHTRNFCPSRKIAQIRRLKELKHWKKHEPVEEKSRRTEEETAGQNQKEKEEETSENCPSHEQSGYHPSSPNQRRAYDRRRIQRAKTVI